MVINSCKLLLLRNWWLHHGSGQADGAAFQAVLQGLAGPQPVMSAAWQMWHGWQHGLLLVPEEHIFQKAIKPSKPHTCCMIYKYITAPNMAKRVAINNPKSHGDLGSPVPLPKVKNVCSVFWFFFFNSVLDLLQYISYLATPLSICHTLSVTLLGHTNAYRMGMEGLLKLLGLSKSCLVNIFHFSLP